MFSEFFKTGLLAAGGGLATLPFLYEMAYSTGWFTTTDIANMVAVSESTPGPLGVNMATYIGFQIAGILGGIGATFSLTTPAVIVVTFISNIMHTFKDSIFVQKIFYGLRPASSALILLAGLGVSKIAFLQLDTYEVTKHISDIVNLKATLLAIIIWWGYKRYKKHPILYIAISACIGIIFSM